MTAALEVRDLHVQLPGAAGPVPAVRGVSFALAPGEVVALSGESGCGKTTVLLALLGLLPPGARCAGSARCGAAALLPASERALRMLRGRRIGAVFQDPAAALDPTMPVGRQVAEAARLHLGLRGAAAAARAAALLEELGLRDGRELLRRYPHELSGGMRQRVALAMGIAADPAVLLADEPTAALDALHAAGALALLRRLAAERRLAVLLVSHDLGAVARVADRVLVMHAGRIVERGPAAEVLAAPAHPYARGLVFALPRPGGGLPEPMSGSPPPPGDGAGCPFAPRCPEAMRGCLRREPAELPVGPGRSAACWLHDPDAPARPAAARPPAAPAPPPPAAAEPLLQACDLRRRFRGRSALDGISLDLFPGRVLGLAGESGCGKSTLARILTGLERPDGGEVRFAGADIHGLPPARRRRIQILLQEAGLSLDPRLRVGASLAEGLPRPDPDAPAALLASVGLRPGVAARFPHELSGGQRERAALARALGAEPAVLVADEPFTGLDASVQAGVARLLHRLCRERGLALAVLGHDLRLLGALADDLAIMLEGRLIERGPAQDVLWRPRHPYTRALLAASALRPAEAGPRTPAPPGACGCPFAPRCPQAEPRCGLRAPELRPAGAGAVACHLADG